MDKWQFRLRHKMIKISPSTSRHNGSRRSVSYLIHRSSLNMLSFNARYAPPIVFDLGSLYLFLVMTSQAPIRRQLVYKVRRLHINGWAHNFFFFFVYIVGPHLWQLARDAHEAGFGLYHSRERMVDVLSRRHPSNHAPPGSKSSEPSHSSA